MAIDWIKLIAALALLLTPISFLQGKRVRFRPLQRGWDGYWGRTFSLGAHTIDLGRAALGAWCLALALTTPPDTRGLLRYAPIVIPAGVLCLATALQTLVCKEKNSANAPFAFVIGILAGYLPPLGALFAVIFACVLAYGMRLAPVFFPLLSVSTMAFGFLLTGKKHLLALGTVAIAVALPWLLTLMFPRPLVSSYQAKRATEDRAKTIVRGTREAR